jgi:hypothetical protein
VDIEQRTQSVEAFKAALLGTAPSGREIPKRQGAAPGPRTPSSTGKKALAGGLAAGALIIVIALALILTPENGVEPPPAAPTPTSSFTTTPTPDATPSPTPEPTPTPTSTPTPEPTPSPSPSPTPTPKPTPAPAPVFTKVSASHELAASSTGKRYAPLQVLDGNTETAWAYPHTDGAWISLLADTEQYVSGIRILNGYTGYNENLQIWLYYANNRPREITISFSDGSSLSAELKDVFDANAPMYQDIPFGAVRKTDSLRITINSVYRGNRWNDTCISGIQVY